MSIGSIDYFAALRRERTAHPELNSDYVPEWATPERRETPMEELKAKQGEERTALKEKHDGQRTALKVEQGGERDALKAAQLKELRVAEAEAGE